MMCWEAVVIVGGIYSVYMSLGSSCVHWVLCGVWRRGVLWEVIVYVWPPGCGQLRRLRECICRTVY